MIVFKNGKSGFLGEHSCMDGTPTLRMTEFVVGAYADLNVLELKQRDIIQFERKGYFILDAIEGAEGQKHLKFIRIPDGRAAGLALKAPGATTAASGAEGANSTDGAKKGIDYSEIKMYKVDPVNKADEIEYPKGMYKVDSVYESSN